MSTNLTEENIMLGEHKTSEIEIIGTEEDSGGTSLIFLFAL